MGLRTSLDRFATFVHDYTAGLDSREVRLTFSRDASRAFGVLTREHAHIPEPEGAFARWWHRAKILFLGLSYKLSPTRRVLFAASLTLAALGLFRAEDPSPVNELLLLGAFAGLVLIVGLELADRIVVRDELEVARQLQRELLPDGAPEIPGYLFAHSYVTANTIGGDYYDFLELPDGRLVLVVGDASGHGIAAGLLMAIANAILKLAVDTDPDPPAVVSMVNRALCNTGGSRAFMSMFYGLLEPTSGKLDFVCAGHPFPILRRADGSIEELGSSCLPLGLRCDLELTSGSAVVVPGDLLVLYSDGIPEAVNQAGAAFGFDRVTNLVGEGGTPQAVHDRLLRALTAFRGDEPISDDSSLVVLARVA